MKKLILSIAALGAVLSAVAPASAAGINGDADCSGTVTQSDVTLLTDVILQRPGAAFGSCGANMDLNCDNALNVFDVTRLQRLVNGFPIPAC